MNTPRASKVSIMPPNASLVVRPPTLLRLMRYMATSTAAHWASWIATVSTRPRPWGARANPTATQRSAVTGVMITQ